MVNRVLNAPSLTFVSKSSNILFLLILRTGSGKSHLIFGPDYNGLISKVYEELSSRVLAINLTNVSQALSIKCSYYQLYNENLLDLLVKTQSENLQIRESKDQGIYI